MHQIHKEKASNANQGVLQSETQPSDTEADPEASLDGPHSKHITARIKQIFEDVISSEELPRQPGSLGSLSDHLNNTGQTTKAAQQSVKAIQSLQQVTAASLNAEKPRKLAFM